MIRRYKLGRDVELHKRTVERGLLSLVGPGAREAAGADGLGPAEHDNAAAEIGGVPVRLVATDGRRRRDLRRRAHRRRQGRARTCPRSPRPRPRSCASSPGRPRYGLDLDDSVIPQEAGLNERAVSFTKGCYVGQETVARLFYRGKPNRHLRGLRLSEPAATGDALRLGEREVGRLGSSVVSPALGPIGLAIVRREAAPGRHRDASATRASTRRRLVELPFRE